MFKICALGFLAVLFCCDFARAEHRSALLIGDDSDKLQDLADGFEKFGFHCQMVPTPDQRLLKSALESFASSTPTHGTAFVYFDGAIGTTNYKGSVSAALLGSDAQNARNGYTLKALFESLTTRGGSRRNLVFIAADENLKLKPELPDSCLVTFGTSDDFLSALKSKSDLISLVQAAGKTYSTLATTATLSGPGSKTISPPERFVLGKRAGDEWVNSRGIVFCWCPPGKYLAGSPEGEPGRYPDETQRSVEIKDGFWLSKYELTLSQNLRNHPRKSIARHKLDPLTMINHDDARAMTTRTLTNDERKAGRLPDDWQYSLPTEDQWEYAARAGTQTAYYFGSEIDLLPQHANFADKSFYDTKDIFSNYAHRTLDDGAAHLQRVGSYQPNSWGFHDMHGNVAEWCINQMARGGSWVNTAADCRCAYRHLYTSRNEQNFIGYRIVIQKNPPPTPQRNKK